MRFAPSSSKSGEERVLPLINVVFLLLIFFLLAGRLAATDPFPVEAPLSLGGERIGGHDLVVHVGADGSLAFNGTVLSEAGLRSAIAHRASYGTVRIKADGQVEARRAIVVMEILREAGIERLELLTRPE